MHALRSLHEHLPRIQTHAGKHYHNCSACSLCCSCDNVCPVKVDLSSQIYRWRQDLDSMHHADKMKKTMSAGMRYVFERPSLYTTALRMAPWANHLPSFITNIKANTWAKGHSMPEFAKLSFHEMWKRGMVVVNSKKTALCLASGLTVAPLRCCG